MTWYVITTAPQLEFRAEEALRQRGIRVVVPHEERELKRRTVSNVRGQFRKYALLPRYIFVELETESELGSLIYAMSRGNKKLITGYLAASGKPGKIAATDVQFLETVSGKRVSYGPEIRTLRIGDVGRIINGPLAGQSSTITGLRGERARMIIKMLDGMREIEVAARSVEVVQPVKLRA
jgi:transcription antitermination factor NusG